MSDERNVVNGQIRHVGMCCLQTDICTEACEWGKRQLIKTYEIQYALMIIMPGTMHIHGVLPVFPLYIFILFGLVRNRFMFRLIKICSVEAPLGPASLHVHEAHVRYYSSFDARINNVIKIYESVMQLVIEVIGRYLVRQIQSSNSDRATGCPD
jgi:hypothetical protein